MVPILSPACHAQNWLSLEIKLPKVDSEFEKRKVKKMMIK